MFISLCFLELLNFSVAAKSDYRNDCKLAANFSFLARFGTYCMAYSK
jgi:hypothetical protein